MSFAALLLVLARFEIEGDIAAALRGHSDAYQSYEAFERDFAAPSRDQALMIRTDDLGAGDALRALEDLILDLSFTDGVLGVLSIFSLPDPEVQATAFLARRDLAGLDVDTRLRLLLDTSPLAAQILSQDLGTTLITLIPDLSLPPEDRHEALEATLQGASPAFDISLVGLPELQRTIAQAMVSDLTLLLPGSILLCLVLSLVLFRSWRAAVVCTLPPILGLVWSLALMAGLGIAMTAFVAIMPTILIVLGISNSVHVMHAIARHLGDMPQARAVALGLIETLPAIVLTTLTTALAFLSLLIVGSASLSELAIVGAAGLFLTLSAVILALPVTAMLLLRPEHLGSGLVRFAPIRRWAVAALGVRRAIAIATPILLIALVAAQSQTRIGFQLTNHVPPRSDFSAALAELERALPGSGMMFVVIDTEDGASDSARARLDAAGQAIYGAPIALPASLDLLAVDAPVARRFLSTDGSAYALPVASPLDADTRATAARVGDIRAALDAAGLGEVTEITGYLHMASVEVPRLVSELRTAFYIAVGIVTVLAILLLRSVVLALVSLVPNLVPILGVEAWLWVQGKDLSLVGAIALTIAFGIAVDDTIHLLNRLRLTQGARRRPRREDMARALEATIPPVVTTSLILLAGFALTVFSSMPSAALFGQLVALAMGLALLADLFLFPSLIVTFLSTEDDR